MTETHKFSLNSLLFSPVKNAPKTSVPQEILHARIGLILYFHVNHHIISNLSIIEGNFLL